MKRICRLRGICCLWSLAQGALAAQPLVDDEWLLANLQNPGMVVLDLQAPAGYQRAHLPGALNTNYGNWRVSTKGGVPKLLPSVAQMEALIGNLGVSNDSLVVLVPFGQSASDMASATRIYWTFKALGHDQVSILDGGLVGYAQGGPKRPLERGTNTPKPATFAAKPRPEYLPDKASVQQALASAVPLVDNRSRAEYLGIYGAGVKNRKGTIPGSANLPYDWLTVNGGGRFHSIEDLRKIYQSVGVPLEGEQISFCHTGHRTSLAWFVSHELLGNEKARMYDGSMAEWAMDPSAPLEAQMQLECGAC